MRHALLTMLTAVIAAAAVVLSAGVASCGEGDSAVSKKKKPIVAFEADPRTDDPTYFRGAPLPFALRLLLEPGEKGATVPTAFHQGAKIEAARVRDGRAEAWRAVSVLERAATRAAVAVPSSRLTPEQRGHAVYLMVPPEVLADFESGDYRLRARIETRIEPDGAAPETISMEASFDFRVTVPATPDERMRFALQSSQFALEGEANIDAAIGLLEEGLRESGRAEIRHHLGWLYVRKGEIAKAIETFRDFVEWARASGIPRVKCCGRGVQEIADEIEAVIPVLEKRLEEERR